MSLRLALVSAPINVKERYGVFSGAASTEPSFGLVCLAAAAQSVGADVSIVEASSNNLSVEESLRKVLKFEPDVVGITSTTAGIFAAGGLAKLIKESNSEIINLIGGCHVTALPEETLRTFEGFDLAVIGEGEKTLEDIVQHLEGGDRDLQTIQGTALREGEKVRTNPSRPLIPNLDELPLPAWSLLGGFPHKYRPSPSRIKRRPCASVVLTRGCPNQCLFCDRSVFGNQCRAYGPNYTFNLFKDLRYNYGVKEILIEDDTFIISRGRIQEICERIITEKLDISWSCLGRADSVDPEILGVMRRAGCWHISYGIESGDQEILKAMRKQLNLEQIKRAVHWSKEAGLYTKGFFMVGFPGESEKSLASTLSLALSLPLDDMSIMQLTPFPGSDIYETVEGYGEFKRDWRRMNTLNTVFVPKGFTREILEFKRADLIRRFYLRPRVILRQVMRVIRSPFLALSLFRGFRSFIKIVSPINALKR